MCLIDDQVLYEIRDEPWLPKPCILYGLRRILGKNFVFCESWTSPGGLTLVFYEGRTSPGGQTLVFYEV